jgi:hypothetical protein
MVNRVWSFGRMSAAVDHALLAGGAVEAADSTLTPA